MLIEFEESLVFLMLPCHSFQLVFFAIVDAVQQKVQRVKVIYLREGGWQREGKLQQNNKLNIQEVYWPYMNVKKNLLKCTYCVLLCLVKCY